MVLMGESPICLEEIKALGKPPDGVRLTLEAPPNIYPLILQ